MNTSIKEIVGGKWWKVDFHVHTPASYDYGHGSKNPERDKNTTPEDFIRQAIDKKLDCRTVQESFFNPTRLLGLQSRLSAAYKGIMALILKSHCQDFISGREMDFTVFKAENSDIHHIFPASYCEKQNYNRTLWNSVVNKTPITYSTNREIGGVAPSVYLAKIENSGKVTTSELEKYVSTHWIDVACCRSDDFDGHIISRAKTILTAIENATGKTISGKDSEEVIKSFGQALI